MQGFSPVTSNKLYIQIYNQLYEAITSGRYAVGDKLPSEKELCQIFNVSRVPVREALCALELNGMVDSVQGGGVFVRNKTSAENELPQDVEPQDIIRARMVLEPDIAREAALHLDEENRAVLQEIYNRMQQEAAVGIISKETDRAFHHAIAKASGSGLYPKIMELVLGAMEQQLWEMILSRTIATKKYQDQNNREHLRICEAILEGRADDAHAGMKAHMEMLYERYWSE
jgi:DNA-binding FadR family transcriptional regulator